MSEFLRIVNWDGHFENSRSRQIGETTWVPVPNTFDGDKMTEMIIEGGDGAYGAWVALILVASKCRPRGLLIRTTGKPHTADTLSRMTRLSKASFESMLEIALSVGLIERCQAPDAQPPPDQQKPVTERRHEPKEQNRERERTAAKANGRGDSVSKSLSGVGSAVELAKTRSAAAL